MDLDFRPTHKKICPYLESMNDIEIGEDGKCQRIKLKHNGRIVVFKKENEECRPEQGHKIPETDLNHLARWANKIMNMQTEIPK